MKSREEYLKRRKELGRLSVEKLEALLGKLYDKRYVDQDIGYESEYRLASSVYRQKVKKGGSLIFHMKNFILSVVV
jgi:hypothetical protein